MAVNGSARNAPQFPGRPSAVAPKHTQALMFPQERKSGRPARAAAASSTATAVAAASKSSVVEKAREEREKVGYCRAFGVLVRAHVS